MSEWILVCNSNYIDIKRVFEKEYTVTWPLIESMAEGDIVYFYVTKPYQAILYKCEVVDTNLYHMDRVAKECVTHALFYENTQAYMRLKLIERYPEDFLGEGEIRKKGIRNLQSSAKVTPEFSEYVYQQERILKKARDNSKKHILIGIASVVIVLIALLMGLIGKNSFHDSEKGEFYTESGVGDVLQEEQNNYEEKLDYYEEGKENLLAKIQNNYSADAVEYVGHVYAIYNIKEENLETWDECESFCEDMGGHLAVIETKEENDFLYQYIREKGLVVAFFGYTDQYSEGNWEWITGENAGYTNWAKGQPNNGKNNKNKKEENYAEFYKETQDGTWNDAPFGSNTHRFICEWED